MYLVTCAVSVLMRVYVCVYVRVCVCVCVYICVHQCARPCISRPVCICTYVYLNNKNTLFSAYTHIYNYTRVSITQTRGMFT